MRTQLTRMIATAACAVGLTLVTWIALVMPLDHRFRGYDNSVWSATLWLSAMVCTGAVAWSHYSVRPVLSCTIAFGLFGLAYMACEGPIFGVVSEGGDPSMTEFVVCNLACLPLGVFAAAEVGSWLGRRHRTSNSDEQPIASEAAGGLYDFGSGPAG
jgi:hypothetical protein